MNEHTKETGLVWVEDARVRVKSAVWKFTTQILLQDEEQWRCTCAHSEKGETERGRGNVAAEVEKLRKEVAKRLRVAFRALMGSGFAFAATWSIKNMNPSARYRMFGVSLAVGVDRPCFFGEDCDCEEPRPATPFSWSQSCIFPLTSTCYFSSTRITTVR
jgi:hypothetical protein